MNTHYRPSFLLVLYLAALFSGCDQPSGSPANMDHALAEDLGIEGAWVVDQSDMNRLHSELDPFINNLVNKMEFENEEARSAAPGIIFEAFIGQKFWFAKIDGGWQQTTEMNGNKAQLIVSFEETDDPKQIRIIKDGKPSFLVAFVSSDEMTLTSIKDQILFPMVRQAGQSSEEN